jgi:hypothetical protein
MQPLKSQLYGYGGELYEISDQDVAGAVQYFGYLNIIGKWIIQKIDTGAAPQTVRYVSGPASTYPASWSGRASLTYGYYNTITNPVP